MASMSIRRRAVRAVWSGETMRAVAVEVGVSYSAVRQWMRRVRVGGLNALRSRPRGRKTGQGRILEAAKEDRLRWSVLQEKPRDLGLDAWVWDARTVRELFKAGEIGQRPPLRTVQEYLRRWGISVLRPREVLGLAGECGVWDWLRREFGWDLAKLPRSKRAVWWMWEFHVKIVRPGAATRLNMGGRQRGAKGATERGGTVSVLAAVNHTGRLVFLRRGDGSGEGLVEFIECLGRATTPRQFLLVVGAVRLRRRSVALNWIRGFATVRGVIDLESRELLSGGLGP